jgi:hypothetical protein
MPIGKRMTKSVVALLFCTLALAIGCGQREDPGPAADISPGATSLPSAELQAVAEQLFGSGARVLASGDLAGTGQRQVLVANGMADGQVPAKQGAASTIIFNRAAMLEQRGGKWNELLLCDEYLKNPEGFLGGTPKSPTGAWQLHFDSGKAGGKIAEFDFTPLQQNGTGRLPKIVVRWNPKSSRYQSFDSATEQFLSEAMSLEPPASELR